MSYLKFDKSLMNNLEQSLTKEMLRTNKSGAYSYSTIVDCNTRRYHGLLVVPLPELDSENHVLISSLDATVIQHDSEFNLGLHKFPGENYSPKGHKYIRQYECDSNPSTIYRVGGVILSKELIFISHENRVLIKFTLLEAHSPTRLRFKPFLTFRRADELCMENSVIDKTIVKVDNGIKMCLYAGYPELNMQLSHKNEFVEDANWYKDVEYPKEQERGLDFHEDQYVPGYFELAIKPKESIYFSAGTTALSPRSMKHLFEKEAASRTPRDSFTNCLKNAAYQLYNKHEDGQRYLLAGYPWFQYRARDMFISLPGCTLAAKDAGLFTAIMETGVKAIRHFMEGKPLDCKITEIDSPDVLLWFIRTVQEYSNHVGMEACAIKYGEIVLEALDFILKKGHSNLFLHENGLLYSHGKNSPISWMNSMQYGKPLVPRSGYLVEFNALWYNDLLFAAELAVTLKKPTSAQMFTALAEKTKVSFNQVFLNQHGYLYDYVNDDPKDFSVRPNMIFAVALEHSPLDRIQQKSVLDIVTKELLTPKGLRTLSPKSGGYNPTFEGNDQQRTRSYHQGTAWPWLIGPYLEAYLKIYRFSGISFAQRIIYGFEEELADRGIGTISELFDGNPPYRGRGGVSYAMNVGEILRIHRIVKNMIKTIDENI
ncbi:MAG TPA: glycogen debranching enzyme N-terminal domain-containing protein [Bacteroidales bacterium]|nr:glycogen debranching enzyme N-terminal domain-containing protein [Bacteroidales bacterium]